LETQALSKKEQLTRSRQELLDLGLRNPLINLSKKRGLPITDEISSEIFRLLVTEGRTMSFLPSAEADAQNKHEDNIQADEGIRLPESHHLDSKLQTAVETGKLQTKLLRMYGEARTLMEEQGINALYLALGMIRWFEDDSSQTERRAPLILIPVDLTRGDASEKFKVKYSDAEIGENLSLAAKLAEDFRVSMPAFPDEDSFSVAGYLQSVRKAVSALSRWKVKDDEIVLGFFSFGKFLMYKDLDGDSWPVGAKPEDNVFIENLFGEGFPSDNSIVTDESHLDSISLSGELALVMDADSSQTAALLDIRNGRNLVIQGPPGTGKSQTITNILSDALGQGKKVLFVAEKMAALDVVKRRMDSVGIGDACVELHSHKTNKRDLLKELRRTIEIGMPSKSSAICDELELLAAKQKLNDYCTAVNENIGQSSTSPYQAMGKVVRLRQILAEVTVPPFSGNVLASGISAERYTEQRNLLAQVQRAIEISGPVERHPFFGVTRETMLPSERSKLEQSIAEALLDLRRLLDSSKKLALVLGRQPFKKLKYISEAISVAALILDTSELHNLPISIRQWTSVAKEIRCAAEVSRGILEGRSRVTPLMIESSWDYDFHICRQRLVAYGNKWWKLLISDFHKAKTEFEGFVQGMPTKNNDERVRILDTIIADQKGRTKLAEVGPKVKEVTKSFWKSENSEWNVILPILMQAEEIQKKVSDGISPEWLLQKIEEPVNPAMLNAVGREAASAYEAFSTHHSAILQFLQYRVTIADQERELSDLLARMESWQANLETVLQIMGLNHLHSEAQLKNAESMFEFGIAWEMSAKHLVDVFELFWHQGLLDVAYAEREQLRHFSSAEHGQIVGKFIELDKTLLDLTKLRLATAHWNQLPRHEAGGQLGLLREEFAKKRRHLPVRQLLMKAGRAIQSIKPIFMMSPMSVATYLVPNSLEFDLVVFDEASQVRPVDALGALLRGKQAIVVGDEKQMPPTSFFDRMLSSDDSEEDDTSVTSDMESVLSMFLGKGCPSRMLRWHYRSRHDSLIAVSNKEFYDNRLVVFPSPDVIRGTVGLFHNHLPMTAYDRGGTRSNPLEARAVAEAVMKHASDSPNLTLLVAAFSVAQATAIEDELEILRRQNSHLEPFFSSNEYEPFVIKNLETVQGDERDVVFISIGYGKTSEGYLAMNFGPLNKEGGERRLNVLITRARSRCEVFTNLKAGDLDLARSQARGVSSLKIFLNYAETGRMDNPRENCSYDDSPFEDAVVQTLAHEGLIVHRQVGSAGFFIDIAIVDPAQQGRYLLGIECDGATYHSARSARDRDRLRQAVLENLGWKLHRIWSTDWFQNPAQELKRLFQALKRAKTDSPVVPKAQTEKPSTVLRESVVPRIENAERQEVPATALEAYKIVDLRINPDSRELHLVSVPELSKWIGMVVQAESPVHINEVFRRIADAWNVQRIGNRISDVLNNAVIHAMQNRIIVQRGDFFWNREMTKPVPRSRANMPLGSRKIELVAPEEIALVIKKVVVESFGIHHDELSGSVVRSFGFGRASADMVSLVEGVIKSVLESGDITETNGVILATQGK
jgi:very-short-patch-repair endonuclease